MSSKVHPQASKGRKQSVISNLIRGLTGQGKRHQISPKKNGEVPISNKTDSKAPTRASSFAFSTSSKSEDESTNKGEVHFWRNFTYDQEGRPFLKVTHDSNIDDTGHVLTHDWKLETPRIVLVVMSNVAPLNQWTNTRQIKNFQKGLMKATNTTEMWILTNGTNVGISKIIGDAVHEEMQRRSSKGAFQKHFGANSEANSKIVLIGIAREDLLNHSDSFNGKSKRVEIENEGNRLEEQKFDLNPDHSHFLIVKDGTISKTGINYFLLRLQQYLATALEHPRKSASYSRHISLGMQEIPVIAVLFQGGTDCARLVLDHLKRHLPLIVMKGSGGLADVLGFAYTEISQRPQGIADAEFTENYLKPELSRKISEKFPQLRDNSLSRNIFRDRILDCVRFAKQNEQVYLTVLNIYEHSCNLENLGNQLLRALFKSQKIDNTNWHAQMHKDLYLTLDWNSPNVAMAEVFLKDPSNKFKIEKAVFEEALLRPQRESFVDLFLSQGFQVHKYLTPRRLIMLFKKMRYQEFFQTVCWEGALGYGPVSSPSKNFIDNDLNWLIEKTTSFENFVSAQELSLNAMGLYNLDPSAAERKAKVLLTFWATFTNRIVLAKTLWKHADQPIHLALILSMLIERLSIYANEATLKLEMEESSRDFADIATSMLDACYMDTPSTAFDLLNEESPEWAYSTAVDIAANAQNKRFLAHICCQKWLTNLFFGKIKIRDLTWGLFTVPTSIKVLLCAFLIFPMYGWTVFQTKEYSTEVDKDITDYESDNESDDKILIKDSPASSQKGPDKSPQKYKFTYRMWSPSYFKRYVIHHPPLWKMIYLMWSAPITKFWTFQMFYVVYLSLFSIAVMWPSCGNYKLDLLVCCWMSLIALESVHPAVRMRRKYKAKAFFLKILEILVMFMFVVMYIFGRLIQPPLIDPYSSRVILCLVLLYFYYRIIAIYLKYKAKAFFLKILEILVMFMFVVMYIFGRLIQPPLIDPYSSRVILCLVLLYFYYRIIAIYLKYKAKAFFLKILEILVMFMFVVMYIFGRLIQPPLIDPYSSRVILCLVLLYFYYRIIAIYLKYKAKAFFLKILEILVMFMFVVMYIFGRLIQPPLIDPYSSRVILCLALLYFYYRIIAIYLPISPTLGPLLYRVKLMVLVDFINFMRMAILVIISGGIVIQAVMYPDHPFNKELFRRTFHKAWFSLFMTPIHDLGGDVNCKRWNDKPYNSTFCKAGEFIEWRCPNVGLWAYVFNIQYFVLLKLILLTLLYALFSATASKLAAESDAIWKYQRYHLVVDFSNRLRLPAPLNIISYIMILMRFFRLIICWVFCSLCNKKFEGPRSDRRHSIKDYKYWNQLAQEYDTIQQTKELERDILENQMDMIRSLMEDFVYQKQMIQSLKTSVRELERLMNYSHVHLENIRHLTHRDSAVSAWENIPDASNRALPAVMNILSRRSPYPGTRVQRFPVPDKYVPWEVMWIGYDPVAFTQQRPDFPVTLQAFVDEDILLIREKHGPNQALPVFAWNSVSVNPAGIGLDRQSWITTTDGTTLTYKLDSEGVPQNPMGRTGLRGRGALPRWGPNHYMLVIITRFQKGRETLLTTKGLEFVVQWTEKRFQLSIPGGFVSGEHRYEVIRSMFKAQYTGNAIWMDSSTVTKFFRECIIQKQELSESTENLSASFKESEESSKVVCDIVTRGYMDDPFNTDHAWKEVELWHVHYDMPDTVADRLQTQMGWRLITEDAFFKLPAGQAVLLQDIARKMKATIL